jgi:ectoine hydroxylase-related dioxygenase (phytanoyl-CoA dioxygenase family)
MVNTIRAMPDTPEAALAADGYRLVPSLASRATTDRLIAAAADLDIGSGLRGALGKIPAAREIAESTLLPIARDILGSSALVVRSILFDKTAASNWLVPWHQDLTIAVRDRRDARGWGPWSLKEGTHHVQPPARVLETMVTLRLHLDDAPSDNGALKVAPASHARGIIPTADIPSVRQQLGEVTCEAQVGDLLIMRPLLLHASSKSVRPGHRRVLHVEFASGELGDGLMWGEGM